MQYRCARCRSWAAVEEGEEGEEERQLEWGLGPEPREPLQLAAGAGAWSGAGAAAGAVGGADEALFSAGGVLLHPHNTRTPTKLDNKHAMDTGGIDAKQARTFQVSSSWAFHVPPPPKVSCFKTRARTPANPRWLPTPSNSKGFTTNIVRLLLVLTVEDQEFSR